MSNKIIESIKNNSRENIKYIYPIKTSDVLGQYISAFSNSMGGYIVLGVSDDGKNLTIKSSVFALKQCEIIAKLSDNAMVKFGEFEYEKSHLKYIEIKKADTNVTCDGIAYVLGAKMKVEKLSIKKLFLSYCHNDKCIADIIEGKLNELAKGRISLTRDIRTMQYKDDIEKFMQTIDQHDFAITIISDKYLKSRGCMYEISELMRNRKYFDKLLFVILSENDVRHYDDSVKESDVKADIYSMGRFEYIKYWIAQIEIIDKHDKEITDVSLKLGIVEEGKKVAVISQNITEFIEKLNKSLGKSLDEMLANDFSAFLTVVLSEEH